jgi:hypothetical protein
MSLIWCWLAYPAAAAALARTADAPRAAAVAAIVALAPFSLAHCFLPPDHYWVAFNWSAPRPRPRQLLSRFLGAGAGAGAGALRVGFSVVCCV